MKAIYGYVSILCYLMLWNATVYAASATATQTITVQTPAKIQLLDIGTAAGGTARSFTYNAPTQAGDAPTLVTTSNPTDNVAFTANRTLGTAVYASGSINGNAMSQYNLGLKITFNPGGDFFHNGSAVEQQLRPGIIGQTGVVATSSFSLKMEPYIPDSNSVPPHGSYTINVTVTLKDS